MPATRHRFSKCSHKGYGAVCNRCKTAEQFVTLAETPKAKRPKKGLGHDWDSEKLLAEAARLRGPQRKKGQPASALPPEMTGQ
jgi:hypothetical protein